MKSRIAFALLTLILTINPLVAGMLPGFANDDDAQDRASRRAERAVEREEELYDDANDYLDDENWRAAADKFRQVAELKMLHADAAMYWRSYALNKLGERAEALSTISEFQKTFPKSKWFDDSKRLEVEIRQGAGQRIAPENIDDEEVKLMAINGLMNSNPERALPLLEKIINGNDSPKLKDKAMFVLSQSNSAKAMEIIGRIARDGSKPEMQSRALRYLGIRGDEDSRRILGDVYQSSNDKRVKSSILKSYMVSGDSGRLLGLAKTEPDEQLRGEAVRQLGIMGAKNELSVLYSTEKSIDVREDIIKAMFLGGNAEKLAEIARTETIPELRIAAIKNLGLIGGPTSARQLIALYDANGGNFAVRKAVIDGLFVSGNAKALVELARKEKDPALKKAIVSKLSVMGGDDATDYMLEILK